MNKRVLLDKINNTLSNSTNLRNINPDKCSFEKSVDIRKKQDEEFRKYKFFKSLYKALDKKDVDK